MNIFSPKKERQTYSFLYTITQLLLGNIITSHSIMKHALYEWWCYMLSGDKSHHDVLGKSNTFIDSFMTDSVRDASQRLARIFYIRMGDWHFLWMSPFPGILESCKTFFPGLFFYIYIKSHDLKKTHKAPHHSLKTPSTENPKPQKPISRPRTKNPNPP